MTVGEAKRVWSAYKSRDTGVRSGWPPKMTVGSDDGWVVVREDEELEDLEVRDFGFS